MKNPFSYFITLIILIGFWLLLIPPQSAYAQNISNQTNLFIPSGLNMYTNGSLTNTGFFQNNGSFFLSGDWTNSSTYQGIGLVSFEGINQAINNNNQSIEYLIINGGGVKILQQNLVVNKQIDFNNGVFSVLSSDTLLIGINGSINGGSVNSYVDGALFSRGTGYKFFPVGKNGKYHPVELLEIKGLDPLIAIEVQEDLPNVKTSGKATIQRDIYWTRKTISGFFEDSPITLGYSTNTSINPLRIVIAEAAQVTDEFSIIENVTLQTNNSVDVVKSRKALTGNIFALGELLVDPPRQQYLSTTLSPNGQNPANRVIKVFGDNPDPSYFLFEVFNRWGVKIFESQSYASMTTDGWDGKQQGTQLSSGAYPFSLRMTDAFGNPFQQTGFINIIQ